MKNKLVALVQAWGVYEEEVQYTDLQDFCKWYLKTHAPTEPTGGLMGADEVPSDQNMFLGRLIGKLSRYASIYAKKAFAPLGLNNFEDLGYLWQTEFMGAPKKSELIYAMMSEFPSGADVIRRLVGMGLLEEFPDDQDRRSKRVRITPKGTALSAQSIPATEKVARIVVGDLDETEKAVLVKLLSRLEKLHDHHYKQVRNTDDFESVYELMVK